MAERRYTVLRMSKALQYALLLVLYLCRAGRARLMDVALSLNLSLTFMRVVAKELRIGRVINSVRGPGGGYEINGDPSVRDVFEAISPVFLLSGAEMSKYVRGAPEHRALAQCVDSFRAIMGPLLRRKVRNLNNELAANEMAALNGLRMATVN